MAQAAMPMPKQMTEKQRNWIKRKSSCASNASPKKSRGTILNAVPAAKIIKMTALEEEMATSPNDEILSAVSDFTRTPSVYTAATRHSALQQEVPVRNKRSSSLLQRVRSERRQDTDSRIGVWMNGTTRWDGDADDVVRSSSRRVKAEQTLRQDRNSQLSRPSLSVMIPGARHDSTHSALVRPTSQPSSIMATPVSAMCHLHTWAADGDRRTDHDLVSPIIPVPVPSMREQVPRAGARPRTSRASSSSSSLTEDEAKSSASQRSSRSSATSAEVAGEVTNHDKQQDSSTESDEARDEVVGGQTAADLLIDYNLAKALSRENPLPGAIRRAHSTTSRPTSMPLPHRRDRRGSTHSLSQLDIRMAAINDISPTLSQAETDLRAQLSAIEEAKATIASPVGADGILSRAASIYRSGSVRSVMQPPERAPTLPRRSRKREWRQPVSQPQSEQPSVEVSQLSRSASDAASWNAQASTATSNTLERSLSDAQVAKLRDSVQLPPRRSSKRRNARQSMIYDDGLIVVEGQELANLDAVDENGAPDAATSTEQVLLHILSKIDSLDDLANTAMINKGMYRVFKENEMHLLRAVNFNESPAAWEFREWCPPERGNTESSKASSQLEHSPKTYISCYGRDFDVLEVLKELMLERCSSLLRPESAAALLTPDHPDAQRLNDSFWRVWCFSKIFGCEKGREDDTTGQLDWLKGGILANNQGCAATVVTSLDFEMSSVLLNAPDHFAKGNADGLTPEQLDDMIEIWNCLSMLLQGYRGRIDQAREYGLFSCGDVEEGDEAAECSMLEEWLSYVLTLGPDIVLEMALHANDNSAAGFELAEERGWTTWSPPQFGTTRSAFLTDSVARLHEERGSTTTRAVHQDYGRRRVSSIAPEVRVRRRSTSSRRSHEMEPAMKSVSRRDSVASAHSHHVTSPLSTDYSAVEEETISSPAYATTPPPQSRSSGQWSPRKISPIIENRVETFNRMSLQNFAPGVADDTSALAVKRIVDMGFTASQAREALRTTDMGDGFRVDRAVDLLLRQR